MNAILYSTKCPQCKVLEAKLKQKNISFEEVNDIDLMRDKGFRSAPVLEIDGTAYDFREAVNWIKEQ